jgi:hypothetical protein
MVWNVVFSNINNKIARVRKTVMSFIVILFFIKNIKSRVRTVVLSVLNLAKPQKSLPRNFRIRIHCIYVLLVLLRNRHYNLPNGKQIIDICKFELE